MPVSFTRPSPENPSLGILAASIALTLPLPGGAIVPSAHSEPLTYEQAVRLAIRADPALRVFDEAAEAIAGETEQSDRRPNPVVGFEIENFLGSAAFSGVESTEITLGLRQTIETAGKREKRGERARMTGDLLQWDREERLVQVQAAVRREFVAALLAQESQSLQEAVLELLRKNEQETARLVEAARAPDVDLMRSRLAVKLQAFALDQSRRALDAAKARLRARIGPDAPEFFEPFGAITLEAEMPELSVLLGSLENTAALARFEALARTRQADLELERSKAHSDVDVFAGARYFNESGDGAIVAGISIPWPLFNQNRGAIRAAEARLRATDFEKVAIRRELEAQLTDLYQDMSAAAAEAKAAREELMPAAEETLVAMQEGLLRGQFSQLRILEAGETLLKIRATWFDALSRYAHAQSEIESITMPIEGTPR